MTSESHWWFWDLLIVGLYTALVDAVVLSDAGGPLRVALVLPLVLLLPGYVLVSVLFPGRTRRENVETQAFDPLRRRARTELPRSYGVNVVERIALSVVVSVAIVPMLAFLLNFSPWALTIRPLLATVSGFVLLGGVVALGRRLQLPAIERFSLLRPAVVPRDIERDGRHWFLLEGLRSMDGPGDWALRGFFAVSLLVFAGSVAYAATAPAPERNTFTEVSLTGPAGDSTATVPREYVRGQSRAATLTVTNQEHEQVEYLVVVRLQRVSNGTVTEQRQLHRFTTTLAHGEAHAIRHRIRPTMSGDDLRLVYLVYRDSMPFEPSVANGYRTLRVDITVSPSSGSVSSTTEPRSPERVTSAARGTS